MRKPAQGYGRKLMQTGKMKLSGVSLLALVSLWPAQSAWATIDNTVTATGTHNASPVVANDSESVDVVDAIASISVTKTADVASVSAAGDAIQYSVAVQNTGNVTATAITVTDTLATLVCPTSGNATIAALAPGVTETCTVTYNATQADFDLNGANDGGSADGDIDNTATATGTANGGPVTDNGSVAVTLNVNPDLTIVKSALLNDEVLADGLAVPGETISYTYVVTNTGNVTITNMRVDDTHDGSGPLVIGGETQTTDVAPTSDSTDAATNGVWDSIAPGDAITFTATYTVTQTDMDNQ